MRKRNYMELNHKDPFQGVFKKKENKQRIKEYVAFYNLDYEEVVAKLKEKSIEVKLWEKK